MSETEIADESRSEHAKSDAPAESPLSSARSATTRWLLRATLAVALGLAATWAVLYWQERPLAQAEAAFAQGNHQRALALTNYFLASHGDNSRALAVKAQALVELGQPVEAIGIFEKTGAATVAEVHAWAKAYLLNQQWSRALPILMQSHALRPRDPDVLHELTTCRIRLGLLTEARESAALLTEIPGQEARGWLMQATIYNDIGDYLKTLECYRKTLDYTPDATGLQLSADDVFLQYGMAFLNSGRPEESVKMFQRSLALVPSTDAYAGLGNAQSLLGESDAAKESWKQAVKLAPHNLSARESLAKAALQERDFEAGQKWLESDAQRVSRSSSAYLMHRLLILAGDKQAGDEWARRAAELRKREQRATRIDELLLRSPHNYWANVIRAHQFAQVGNWSQAEDMMGELSANGGQDPFIRKLTEAIRARSTLPSLDELPDSQF